MYEYTRREVYNKAKFASITRRIFAKNKTRERAAQGEALELERRTLFLTSLLEPVLILAMGMVVLLIVLAALMPIIEINQLVR
jgi:hypothetical protein